MPTKCDICTKSLTKKVPGLECRSCGKVVHATQICTGLTAKQIAALKNTDSLEWSCEECHRDSPRRKSVIIPEEDDEEEEEVLADGAMNIDSKKFLRDISNEMKKILKNELLPIETSVGICCGKIDDLTKTVEAHQSEIKSLRGKCAHLENTQKHLQLEVDTLKQYVRSIDQQRLDSTLEVFGVPKLEDENITDISNNLAEALHLDKREILFTRRVDGRNGKNGVILLGLQQVQQAERWARVARSETLTVGRLISGVSQDIVSLKVILRRALTKENKTLLWQAQQKLKPAFKYVWFQDGKVLARKDDNAKPQVARSEEDILKIFNEAEKVNVQRQQVYR